MKCEFCNKECRQDGQWWDCYHCDVAFEESRTLGHHVKFERSIRDWDYALNLYPEANITVLTGFHASFFAIDKPHRPAFNRLEIKIPHMMKNVNQHNALDKIRFILLFQ